jgi:AcrR family transcriptional regulator
MRRVADVLGTGPASLYRHVAGRDELVALVVDHVIGSLPRARPPRGDWRTLAEWTARRFRAHLLDHRAFVPLITSAQLLGPQSMRGRESVVSMLIRQGFSPVDAVRTQLVLQHFIVATVQLDVRAAARTPAAPPAVRRPGPGTLPHRGDPRRHPVDAAERGRVRVRPPGDARRHRRAAIGDPTRALSANTVRLRVTSHEHGRGDGHPPRAAGGALERRRLRRPAGGGQLGRPPLHSRLAGRWPAAANRWPGCCGTSCPRWGRPPSSAPGGAPTPGARRWPTGPQATPSTSTTPTR